MSKIKRIVIGILVVAVLAVIGYGAYLGYNVFRFTQKISSGSSVTQGVYEGNKLEDLKPAVPESNLNILVVGIDAGRFKNNTYRSDTGRTDTIMLFSINPTTKKVALLSIPRDTYVEIEGRGMDKVNHAYAFGGMNLSIKTLSAFLGIPINHYIKVDYESFVKIVNGLGGVTVDVPEDVVSYQDGKVKVQKGVQKMDGDAAFSYVQVREGDIDRIGHQQNFVKTLAAQALTLSTIPKLPGILNSIAADIETDMSPKEILELAMRVRTMDIGNIHNEIVPGRADMIKGISYWIPDQAGTLAAVKRVFN